MGRLPPALSVLCTRHVLTAPACLASCLQEHPSDEDSDDSMWRALYPSVSPPSPKKLYQAVPKQEQQQQQQQKRHSRSSSGSEQLTDQASYKTPLSLTPQSSALNVGGPSAKRLGVPSRSLAATSGRGGML